MPRTTYRFRVAPLLVQAGTIPGDMDVVEQGEWSEISNIGTKDNQSFDAQNSNCASLVAKGRQKWINFERAGTMLGQYGYSFGDHLWTMKVTYAPNNHSINNNPL